MRKPVVLVALLLAGCATKPPMTWARADGKQFVMAQLTLDQTICQGEMQKAHATVTSAAGITVGDLRQVYVGCMAQHAWIEVPG